MTLPIDLYATELKKLNNIAVPMSGGVDSECIAYACVYANLSFVPVIVEYYYDGVHINGYDIQYAYDFCKKHSISPIVFKLDFNWFYEQNAYLEYAIKYKVVSPQLCCHMWLMEQLLDKNVSIVFNGDVMPPIRYGTETQYTIPHMPYMYYSYHRFLLDNSISGIGSMATHTDGIISSYVKIMTDNYDELLNLDRYSKKCKIYQLGGFKIDKKPEKFTGFEEMKKMCTEKSGRTDGRCHFDETYRMPLYNIVKEPTSFNYMALSSFELIRNIAKYVSVVTAGSKQ